MAQIGGYRSPVDLGLGRVPSLEDPAAFEELTQVYNAIHLLNEYLDNLRNEAMGGGSGQNPAETMIFNRFFVGRALMSINAGMPVCPSPYAGANGIIRGALPSNMGITNPTSNFCGIAMTGAAAGQDVRVGVGPAALQLPGAMPGSLIYAYAGITTGGGYFYDGGLYIGNPGPKTTGYGTSYPMPVAIGITPGYIMFGQHIRQ